MTSAPRSAKKVATWPGPKLDSITRILLRSPSAPLVGLVTTSSGHISDGPSETSRGIPGSTFRFSWRMWEPLPVGRSSLMEIRLGST